MEIVDHNRRADKKPEKESKNYYIDALHRKGSSYTFHESYTDEQGKELFRHSENKSPVEKPKSQRRMLEEAATKYRREFNDEYEDNLQAIKQKYEERVDFILDEKNFCENNFQAWKMDVEVTKAELKQDIEEKFQQRPNHAKEKYAADATMARQNFDESYDVERKLAVRTYVADMARAREEEKKGQELASKRYEDDKKTLKIAYENAAKSFEGGDTPYDPQKDLEMASIQYQQERKKIEREFWEKTTASFKFLENPHEHAHDHVSYTFAEGKLGLVSKGDQAVKNILQHLKFEKVPLHESVQAGDVVTYLNDKDEIVYTATVVELDSKDSTKKGNHLVRGKWGGDYPPIQHPRKAHGMRNEMRRADLKRLAKA